MTATDTSTSRDAGRADGAVFGENCKRLCPGSRRTQRRRVAGPAAQARSSTCGHLSTASCASCLPPQAAFVVYSPHDDASSASAGDVDARRVRRSTLLASQPDPLPPLPGLIPDS